MSDLQAKIDATVRSLRDGMPEYDRLYDEWQKAQSLMKRRSDRLWVLTLLKEGHQPHQSMIGTCMCDTGRCRPWECPDNPLGEATE